MLRRLLLALFPVAAVTGCAPPQAAQPPEGAPPTLNYDHLLHLDAEELAEGGVLEAYRKLLPELRRYVPEPQVVTEDNDDQTPRYTVRSGTKQHLIQAPEIPEADTWGRATYAFFSIVNDQLESTPVRFYALYNGNDLGGMFLTPSQATAARSNLPNKFDWPYLPTNEPPYFGMHH